MKFRCSRNDMPNPPSSTTNNTQQNHSPANHIIFHGIFAQFITQKYNLAWNKRYANTYIVVDVSSLRVVGCKGGFIINNRGLQSRILLPDGRTGIFAQLITQNTIHNQTNDR